MKTLLLTKGYAAFRASAFLVYQTTVVPIEVQMNACTAGERCSRYASTVSKQTRTRRISPGLQ